MNIIIATIKSWNIKNTDEFIEKNLEYNIKLITDKENLNLKNIEDFNPDYIFFPHWSWIIPEEIYSNYNCIV
ncbi:MAG: methionyl-tRNA formyltransferase, partial [Halanaerobiales bacterium]